MLKPDAADTLQRQLLDFLDEVQPDPIALVIAMNRITNDVISSFRKLEHKDKQ